MSRFILGALAVALLVSGIGVAGAAGDGSDREKELLGEIAQLQKRVEVLEEKLKALEARSAQPSERSTPPMTFRWAPAIPPGIVPQLTPESPNRLPSGTIEREFNGMKYFIMPIADSDTGPSTIAAPTLAPALPAR